MEKSIDSVTIERIRSYLLNRGFEINKQEFSSVAAAVSVFNKEARIHTEIETKKKAQKYIIDLLDSIRFLIEKEKYGEIILKIDKVIHQFEMGGDIK